jgi:putative ABC transport system permease protein
MGASWQNLRYGARMLIRHRGFALMAAVVLALGIGADTAFFSVVCAVLFSPLPFDDAKHLVLIQTAWGSSNMSGICSGPDYLDWAKCSRVMDGVAAVTLCERSLTRAGEPLAVQGFGTTTNIFDVLRPDRMTLGRAFLPAEGHVGRQGVTVLSHGLWRDRFHADPNILGHTITLDDTAFAVVGVAKPLLGFLEEFARFYIPITREELTNNSRGMHYLLEVGHLKPHVSLAQAQAQMDLVTVQIDKENPDTNLGKRVRIESLHEILIRTVRTVLLVLYGAVTVVLLIACANVSNLLVVKGAVRSREIAVRQAVGAGCGRLLRQLLTESVLLGLLGGVLGLVLTCAPAGPCRRHQHSGAGRGPGELARTGVHDGPVPGGRTALRSGAGLAGVTRRREQHLERDRPESVSRPYPPPHARGARRRADHPGADAVDGGGLAPQELRPPAAL